MKDAWCIRVSVGVLRLKSSEIGQEREHDGNHDGTWFQVLGFSVHNVQDVGFDFGENLKNLRRPRRPRDRASTETLAGKVECDMRSVKAALHFF